MKSNPNAENIFTSEAPLGVWGDKFAARLLMVSFFLPQTAQIGAMMLPCLYFIFRTVQEKEPVLRSNLAWAFLVGGFYLLNLFSFPLTPPEYRHFLGLLCQRRITILLMPVMFAIIAPRFREAIMGEILYFVYGCFVVCVAGNADFIYHYLTAQGGVHLSHVQYRVMFEEFTGIHPTYMSMFLSFAVCVTLLLYPATGIRDKIIKYGLVYLLLVFLLSLLAKSPIIALAAICMHMAYVHRNTLYRYKLLLGSLLIAIVAACFFIPFIGQRINEMVQFAGNGRTGNVADNSVYVRQLIWKTDTDLLRQYWLTGVGPGRMLHMLHERYFFYSISHQFPVGYYDPHNEYISNWLSFGIIGILLLLTALVAHFLKALHTKNYLYLYLLIIFAVTFFTETVLSRQKGVLFFAVFTSLFFFYSGKTEVSRKGVEGGL